MAVFNLVSKVKYNWLFKRLLNYENKYFLQKLRYSNKS